MIGKKFTLENHDYASWTKSRRRKTWRTSEINGVRLHIYKRALSIMSKQKSDLQFIPVFIGFSCNVMEKAKHHHGAVKLKLNLELSIKKILKKISSEKLAISFTRRKMIGVSRIICPGMMFVIQKKATSPRMVLSPFK